MSSDSRSRVLPELLQFTCRSSCSVSSDGSCSANRRPNWPTIHAVDTQLAPAKAAAAGGGLACRLTDSSPLAMPTASVAQSGDRPRLSTGAGYRMACVT